MKQSMVRVNPGTPEVELVSEAWSSWLAKLRLSCWETKLATKHGESASLGGKVNSLGSAAAVCGIGKTAAARPLLLDAQSEVSRTPHPTETQEMPQLHVNAHLRPQLAHPPDPIFHHEASEYLTLPLPLW